MKEQIMELGNYRVYRNTETLKFDIFKRGVGFIITCTSVKACQEVLDLLNKEDTVDEEIQKEADRLNGIKESRIDGVSLRVISPANDNSLLESPLARATKEYMRRLK